MASSRSLVIATAVTLFCAVSVSANVIDDTCNQYEYIEPGMQPNYCRDCLNADPKSATSDFRGLAGIMFDCAKAMILLTRSLAFDAGYKECSQIFNDAYAQFKMASEDLHMQRGDTKPAKAAALSSTQISLRCRNTFKGVKFPDSLLEPFERIRVQCAAAVDLIDKIK